MEKALYKWIIIIVILLTIHKLSPILTHISSYEKYDILKTNNCRHLYVQPMLYQ